METLKVLFSRILDAVSPFSKKKKKTPETEIFDFELEIFKIGLDVGNFSFSSVCNNDSLTFSFFFFVRVQVCMKFDTRIVGSERNVKSRFEQD